jgi:putative solute:sodium symporter small subunit
VNAQRKHACIDNSPMQAAAPRTFWSRTLRVTAALLGLWFAVAVLVPWFASELGSVAGMATMYWLAAKGSLLMFLAIIVVYAWWMDRLEARWHEEQVEQAAVLTTAVAAPVANAASATPAVPN